MRYLLDTGREWAGVLLYAAENTGAGGQLNVSLESQEFSWVGWGGNGGD